jgi:hypothetical protein
MTQIPILSGVYSDSGPDFRTSYPVNLIPVPKENGISSGYLRPADGMVSHGTGPGVSRGGINWNGVCYRVMGTKLVKELQDGTVQTLGDVGGSGDVTMDYSFDKLAIASGGRLYYWDGTTLSQVTDVDLGTVLDFKWIDGYFMTTDGTSLVVTELTDPLAVNPLKYGSSEVDPDPIKAVLKFRNEIYALNRYTIEAFDNIGGDFFPFQRIDGAQIQKGTVGTHACCLFMDALAFIGGARNEAPGVHVGINAGTVKISTREVDTVLKGYTEAQLATSRLEVRNDKANVHLYVHLPDRTLVYDAEASKAMKEHVWFNLTSSTTGFSEYRARDYVWCYDKWLCADTQTANVGYFTDTTGHHWGSIVRWEFGTTITYNAGRGGIFHELELVDLPGRVALGTNPQVSTSYSVDGETWSQDKWIAAGGIGDRAKRLVWRQQGFMRNWRVQRFNGDSNAHLSFARLEAQIEPLAV